jgi:hypothetical protein
MDGIQKLLIVVIVALTLLLTMVGVQVVLMIYDLRKSLRRLNTILEDALLGGGLIRPEKLTGILELFKKGKRMEKHGDGEMKEDIPQA